ncbi:MAG TPA: MBL fold metallo-hydrolase [Candidatus Bathyarchaeia archaeon]|nr:MBL fold metallo-hydrolase [Candidatus Bathyarchaeia archaeon]
MDRRSFLRGTALLGGLTLCPRIAGAQAGAGKGGSIVVRWLGGGVVELATPDYKQMAYIDAWIWNNAGWSRFNVPKPPEYASKDGFVQYVKSKSPQALLVLLTHDHGDHIGDYFEMLQALNAAGVPLKTGGQSDLMRKGLVPEFKNAGLDPAQIVLNGGGSMNFGGTARHGDMTVHLVPAVHSTLAGYPAAGFILEIGEVRVYASGDTDVFGDMKLIGERYRPQLGFFCVGDGPYTMGPGDAARACQMMGVSQAVPVHYAHNPQVLGVQAGEEFRRAVAAIAPSVKVHVIKPGESLPVTS